jgi:hypothetical protein
LIGERNHSAENPEFFERMAQVASTSTVSCSFFSLLAGEMEQKWACPDVMEKKAWYIPEKPTAF